MNAVETERVNISTGSALEPLRGYSRAVRAGDHLYVSGTTSVDEAGEVVFAGDAYEQTKYVLMRIRDILSTAGFDIRDVVRTRLYVTNMARWDEYARAHREVFEAIRPASSIVQVVKLVDPRLVIEMEVEAIRGCRLVESITIPSRKAAGRP